MHNQKQTPDLPQRSYAKMLLVVALGISFPVGAAPVRTTLTGSQIRATFAGKVITDGFHWSYYLKPDGSIQGTELGRTRQGKWSIQGNELCIDISKGQRPASCWGMVRQGKTLTYQINGNDMQDVMVEEHRPP